MKHFYSLLIMGFVMLWQITYATETEPNNTAVKANILALNGSDSGKINPAGDVDWWKITTIADGKLNITLSNFSGKTIVVSLYDSNSTTLLKSSNAANTFVQSTDGLAVGTYYLKVTCASTTDTAKYTISNSLDLPAQAKDAEPNDSKAQALSLALNGTKTGHVGYYYNNKRDTADWYKITTNKDGKLNLSLTPVNGSATWVYLYDNDGTTVLNSKDSIAAFTLSTDGLASGTYYVKVKCLTSSKFTPYTLTNNLVTLAEAIDVEPNNSKTQAIALTLNSTKTGHIGYYYDNKRDTTDWYKVTTGKDGKLNLALTPVNGTNTAIYLYDNNGTTLLASRDSTVAFKLSKDGLGAGTYYVKINCAVNSQFTSYTLKGTLDSLSQVTDLEPNNTKSQAFSLTLNSTQTGHVGYYYSGKRDTADWYQVTTNKDGKLNFTLTPASGANTGIYLYDNNGTTLLASKDSMVAFTLSKDGLAAGTYFIKINCTNSAQFTSYSLTNNLAIPGQGGDPEPNNTKAQAYALTLNATQTGHVGYYYNGKRDTTDWYQVTTDKDGKLNFTLTPASGANTGIYLYDNNGTTLLASKDSTVAFKLSMDGLAQGTYFIKVNCTSTSGFTAYTLANTLDAVAQANDVEPDNAKAQAITLNLNSSKTGHVGYYYNNKRDTADWYKFTTKVDSKLKLKVSLINGQSVKVSLYAGNGISLIDTAVSGSTFSLFTDGLEDDVYYVKINCKIPGGFAPYTLSDSIFAPPTTDTLILPLNYRIRDTLNPSGDVDWFKVTTNADGKLNFTLTPLSGRYTWLYLYDHDGTTLLNSSYASGTFTQSTDGLAAGTYYVRVNNYYGTDTSGYLLADTLSVYSQSNDKEPNNTKAQALTLKLNSSATGNVGYFYNNKRDTADWYKLTTNADGRLKLTLTPVNGSYAYIYLYDNDGTTLLNSNYSSSQFTVNTDGLAAGTYYVRVNCYYTNGFTPYILADSLLKPAQANDIEPNNTKAQAVTLNENSAATGHVGYYYNNKRDTADWYKLIVKADGLLNVNLASANGSYTWIYLYDGDGTTLLNSNYSTTAFTVGTNGLAAGTYYVKVNCYYNYQFTPYTLSYNLVKPDQGNDAEPNNTRAQALVLKVNGSTTGDVGYYYNNKRDTADWYKVTTTKDGMLKLGLTPENGSYLYVSLYDNDGTTLINTSYSSGAFIQNTDGLAAGTYYVKVNCYYNNGYTPYTLTDSLFTYSYASDVEPNKQPYQGTNFAANSTVTGHVNFYYKLAKDTADWFKLNYTGSGNLQFTLNLAPKLVNGSIPYTGLFVYKDTLSSPIYSYQFFTAPSNTIDISSLVKGIYYIKIMNYYNYDYVTYSLSNSFSASAAGITANAQQRAPIENKLVVPGNNITVYPNPAVNRFHIQLEDKEANIASIILHDANGQQVWSQSKLGKVPAGGSLDVNVQKFPGGNYYLQIIDMDGKSTIKKIVIIK